MLFFESLLIVILCLCLYTAQAYIMLIISKCRGDKSFDILFIELKKHIFITKEFLESFNNSDNIDAELVNETISFITKLTDFSVEKDGNERIIGYANAIFINMEKILILLTENNFQNNVYKKYQISEQNFENTKLIYNSKAKRLKHYIDTFPSSLIARFKNIRTMDYIK